MAFETGCNHIHLFKQSHIRTKRERMKGMRRGKHGCGHGLLKEMNVYLGQGK